MIRTLNIFSKDSSNDSQSDISHLGNVDTTSLNDFNNINKNSAFIQENLSINNNKGSWNSSITNTNRLRGSFKKIDNQSNKDGIRENSNITTLLASTNSCSDNKICNLMKPTIDKEFILIPQNMHLGQTHHNFNPINDSQTNQTHFNLNMKQNQIKLKQNADCKSQIKSHCDHKKSKVKFNADLNHKDSFNNSLQHSRDTSTSNALIKGNSELKNLSGLNQSGLQTYNHNNTNIFSKNKSRETLVYSLNDNKQKLDSESWNIISLNCSRVLDFNKNCNTENDCSCGQNIMDSKADSPFGSITKIL